MCGHLCPAFFYIISSVCCEFEFHTNSIKTEAPSAATLNVPLAYCSVVMYVSYIQKLTSLSFFIARNTPFSFNIQQRHLILHYIQCMLVKTQLTEIHTRMQKTGYQAMKSILFKFMSGTVVKINRLADCRCQSLKQIESASQVVEF